MAEARSLQSGSRSIRPGTYHDSVFSVPSEQEHPATEGSHAVYPYLCLPSPSCLLHLADVLYLVTCILSNLPSYLCTYCIHLTYLSHSDSSLLSQSHPSHSSTFSPLRRILSLTYSRTYSRHWPTTHSSVRRLSFSPYSQSPCPTASPHDKHKHLVRLLVTNPE